MRHKKNVFFALGLLATGLIPAAAATATEPAFAPVEKAIKDRTGLEVRWARDAAARDETLRAVRIWLRQPLTLRRAVQIALLHNPDLHATFEEIGLQAADLLEAGALKNPSIDLSIRFPDRAPKRVNLEEAVIFDFLDLLMRPLRQRVAEANLQAAQLRVADEVLKLASEVKSAVYMLEADTMLVAQGRLIRDGSGAALELAQNQHAAGNITDLELLKQQSSYNMARLELAQSEAEQREHREVLNRLLGLWGDLTNWRLPAPLPALPSSVPTLAGLESRAVAQRLDLAAAQLELGGTVRSLGLARTYRYVGALEFGLRTEREREGDNLTGPSLRLELPIFHQGQARLARSEAMLRRAEVKLEGLAIKIRSEVRETHDRVRSRQEMARFYRDDVVPGKRAIVEQSLLRYNGMLLGNYELFTARQEQAEAERKAITALRDFWIARAQLERAVGGTLQERSSKSFKTTIPIRP